MIRYDDDDAKKKHCLRINKKAPGVTIITSLFWDGLTEVRGGLLAKTAYP